MLGKKHKEVNNGVEIMYIFMHVYVYYVYYVHIYTQLFTSSLDRRLIIQHANMLIALRKEHLQDTEPFLRHLDLAAVRSPYNHIH